MKPTFFLTLLAAASSLQAGTPKDAITQPEVASPWRFGVGYAPLIGLKTEFSGLGTFDRNFPIKPLGGGRNYNYDNGFVRLDSSGNKGATTWNWRYDDSSQHDASNGGAISYSLTNSTADAEAREDGGISPAIDCFAYYEMGAVNLPLLGNPGVRWGFRGGLHYAHVDVDNSSVLSSGTFVVTDRFNLGGIVPPDAPYAGSFDGPGPLIGDSPVRSNSEGAAAVVAGSRELDVNLTTLGFGGYLELPVCKKVDLMLEGGVLAALASGRYKFQSNTTIVGLGTRDSSGRDSETSVLPGAYLGLSGVYQIDPKWSIQASGRYQYLNDFTLGDGGSEAELSFGSAFIVSLGVLYSF